MPCFRTFCQNLTIREKLPGKRKKKHRENLSALTHLKSSNRLFTPLFTLREQCAQTSYFSGLM